jgi:NADPH2:quinone reductase
MKALTATGNPSELVTISEVPEPTPGPDEVLVEVEAFSVNRGEALTLSGAYGPPAAAGSVPGQDVVGTVLAGGPGNLTVGQRVVGHPAGGGWAERVAVPLSALTVLPESVPTLQAATLPLAGITALRLLRETDRAAGRRVLLTGASGGVGHFTTELAALSGMEITAVTASAERGERLLALGAAHVVHAVEEAEGLFDYVLESVGGETFGTAISRLTPGGTVIWLGQASLVPVTLDFFALLAVTPFTIRHFPHWVATTTDAEDLATLVDLVDAGKLHPEVGRSADWSETASVLADVVDRRVRGNAVLTIR